MTLVRLGASVPDLKIGDLARATGKTQRALRLYEEMGLLVPSERTVGGFRVYGCDASGSKRPKSNCSVSVRRSDASSMLSLVRPAAMASPRYCGYVVPQSMSVPAFNASATASG